MISIDRTNDIDIISFSVNRINALITDEIRESIIKIFDNANARVIINLKGVEYIDSSGFGCFLTVLKTARNNYGALKFASPEPPVSELLHTLYLHTVFQIFDSIDDCLRSFN